jgi:hypothetical protein
MVLILKIVNNENTFTVQTMAMAVCQNFLGGEEIEGFPLLDLNKILGQCGEPRYHPG